MLLLHKDVVVFVIRQKSSCVFESLVKRVQIYIHYDPVSHQFACQSWAGVREMNWMTQMMLNDLNSGSWTRVKSSLFNWVGNSKLENWPELWRLAKDLGAAQSCVGAVSTKQHYLTSCWKHGKNEKQAQKHQFQLNMRSSVWAVEMRSRSQSHRARVKEPVSQQARKSES